MPGLLFPLLSLLVILSQILSSGPAKGEDFLASPSVTEVKVLADKKNHPGTYKILAGNWVAQAGSQRVTVEIWTRHQTPDTRHQTPDTRHQTPDIFIIVSDRLTPVGFSVPGMVLLQHQDRLQYLGQTKGVGPRQVKST